MKRKDLVKGMHYFYHPNTDWMVAEDYYMGRVTILDTTPKFFFEGMSPGGPGSKAKPVQFEGLAKDAPAWQRLEASKYVLVTYGRLPYTYRGRENGGYHYSDLVDAQVTLVRLNMIRGEWYACTQERKRIEEDKIRRKAADQKRLDQARSSFADALQAMTRMSLPGAEAPGETKLEEWYRDGPQVHMPLDVFLSLVEKAKSAIY